MTMYRPIDVCWLRESSSCRENEKYKTSDKNLVAVSLAYTKYTKSLLNGCMGLFIAYRSWTIQKENTGDG